MQNRSSRRHRSPKRPRCSTTGLIRLRDKKDAKLELRSAYMLRARAAAYETECGWTVVRAFRCTSCRGFHLTSIPARAAKEAA